MPIRSDAAPPSMPAAPIPFHRPLHLVDDQHSYFVDRPPILPWCLLLALAGFLVLQGGYYILVFLTDPAGGAELTLGLGVLIAAAIIAAVGGVRLSFALRTRRVDIGPGGEIRFCILNWRGRVVRESCLTPDDCELRIYPIHIDGLGAGKHRPANPVRAWEALVLVCAGEQFVLAVQMQGPALEKYLHQLPQPLQQLRRTAGVPIYMRLRKVVATRIAPQPTIIAAAPADACACGYDLSGLPLDHQRCPECGTRRLA